MHRSRGVPESQRCRRFGLPSSLLVRLRRGRVHKSIHINAYACTRVHPQMQSCLCRCMRRSRGCDIPSVELRVRRSAGWSASGTNLYTPHRTTACDGSTTPEGKLLLGMHPRPRKDGLAQEQRSSNLQCAQRSCLGDRAHQGRHAL